MTGKHLTRKKKWPLCEAMRVLAKAGVVTTVQYITASKPHTVLLKLHYALCQLYLNGSGGIDCWGREAGGYKRVTGTLGVSTAQSLPVVKDTWLTHVTKLYRTKFMQHTHTNGTRENGHI